MANSVLTTIKSDREQRERSQWHDQELTVTSAPLTFSYTFKSRDQAVAVCRMLDYQVELLRQQAEQASTESDSARVPYMADILADYSNVLSTLLEEVKKTIEE